MTADKIITLPHGSVLQHGELNKRVYLMKLNQADFPAVINTIDILAKENGYSKIFAKLPAWAAPVFIANGFICEAIIPQFYNAAEDAFFLSKFLNSDRLLNIETNKLESLSGILAENNKTNPLGIKHQYVIRRLTESDIDYMVNIFKQVFESYPFPIHNPAYIATTMNEHVQYFGVFNNQQLVAISSAEVDHKSSNAEMTDFATLPEFRGNKLALLLLHAMEQQMKDNGIATAYTIARTNSIPMNKTFLNMGYKYAGTLQKNTNISGQIESMNVLYKHLH